MMEKPLYFAYGSNINLDQMRYRSIAARTRLSTDRLFWTIMTCAFAAAALRRSNPRKVLVSTAFCGS